MPKRKLGGGLLLPYDRVKKREMDAKSGSVLPTTPRKERYKLRRRISVIHAIQHAQQASMRNEQPTPLKEEP